MNADFLVLNYRQMDFLINRNQFISSLFLEREIMIKSPLVLFNSITFFNQECLLIFDFDTYLNSLFGCECDNAAKLILVADTKNFTAVNREVVSRLNLKGRRLKFSPSYIAIKVSSRAEISSISLKELKLVPSCLRRQQETMGILGVRFPAGNNIQYFIDSETIIINSLLKRKVPV